MPNSNFEDYIILLRQKCSNCSLGKIKNPIAKAYGEQSLSWEAFQELVGADLGDLVDYSRIKCPNCLGKGYFETWVSMDDFIESIAPDVAQALAQKDLLHAVFGDKEDQS